MKITGFDSVCLWSANPLELAKFYREKLGLVENRQLNLPEDTGVEFKIGEVILFIGYHDKVSGDNKDPYRMMIGFKVASVKQTALELTKKGVQFEHLPSLSPDETFSVATIKDPEGNLINFFGNKEEGLPKFTQEST